VGSEALMLFWIPQEYPIGRFRKGELSNICSKEALTWVLV